MLHIISNGTENSCFNLKDSLPWFNFSLITKKSILLVRPVSKHEKYDLFIGKICFMPLRFGIHRQYFKLIITYNWWSKLENVWKNVTFVFIHGCRKGRIFYYLCTRITILLQIALFHVFLSASPAAISLASTVSESL